MSVQSQQITIQAQWILDQGNVPLVVNQLLIQDGPPAVGGAHGDGVYLTLGHLNPPVVPGAPGVPAPDTNGQIFPVIAVGRYFLSRDRLRSFYESIGSYLEASDEQYK